MTDAAVKFALLDAPKRKIKPLTEEWIDLKTKTGKKSQARNALAHFQARTNSHAPRAYRILLAPIFTTIATPPI